MERRQVAMIIARPSRLRDGLETLIAAIPQIDAITLVDDGLASSAVVAELCPALVLLDAAAFNDDCEPAVSVVKAAYPNTKCILLVDSLNELHGPQANDADRVLLKGFSGPKLHRIIGELLPQSASCMHLDGGSTATQGR